MASPAKGTSEAAGTDPTEQDLKFAKETTDLVLNYLNEQENEPNPELLERLNWTEDDMRDFLRRWQAMRDQAQSGDIGKTEAFEQQLKSLGLRPRGQETPQSRVSEDEMRGLRQDAARATIPFEMLDGFKAFQKAKAKRETQSPAPRSDR
jgi:hypothetical protein